MKILGIDYGERKIGLAISEGNLAEPLRILDESKAPNRILDICRRENIEMIVIGVSEGKMFKRQSQFGADLERLTGLPIEFMDETLTSKEAVAKMREAGKKIKKEDAIAAALILQSYLDRKKNV